MAVLSGNNRRAVPFLHVWITGGADMNDIGARARALGIQPDYEGTEGARHRVPQRSLERLVAAFGAGTEMPPQELTAPPRIRCHLPGPRRLWGVAVQLYQLRSARNWGIGDLADLESLVETLAAQGADFIGLNPLHAMFLSDPARCSPFSPSNRRFLNPLYLAVDRVAGFVPAMMDGAEIARLRDTDLVDYPGVAAAKLRVLRAIWDGLGRPDADDAFRQEGGADLDRHALFEAVSARMVAQGHGAGWRGWPASWHDPVGPDVAAFARDAAEEVAFHRWLQGETDRQLARVQDACARAGMAVGLYLDIAVGEAADGSGSWGRPEVLSGASIGAPPDYFNETGQDWALAPLSPVAMAATRAAPFAGLMRRVMARAGAVRIDHAMGLWQLFLIPEGATPAEGAYARYPLHDMLRALAGASNTSRTVVIGEDLGNVPPGFRPMMEAMGILSYRILFFERDGTDFAAPGEYPVDALACLSTHDLPTLAGWWRGLDVDLRERHGLIGADTARQQADARPAERRALRRALATVGLPADGDADGEENGEVPMDILVAAHRYVARTPSWLMAARLEDLAGEIHPVNLPSTRDEYPNWRRKLGRTIDELARDHAFNAVLAGIRTERPPASGA